MWHWWINFIGGVAGALAFAHGARPNPLFPPGADPAKSLWLGALFSALGPATLAAGLLVGPA